MRRFLLVLCLAVAASPAGEARPRPKAAADAGTPQRVVAPWGRMAKRYPGVVINRYGKYVEVRFDDGYTGWCAGDLVTPPVEPLPRPDDKNPWTEGQRVKARWSLKGYLPAVVVDTYGMLTLVNFESDDRAWIPASEIRPRDKPRVP